MATAKLTSNDISEIAFQDDVDSYPLRTNFANLKNAINGVVDDIAAASIGTTNAETTAARPYHTSLNSRLDSMWKGQSNYIKYGGVVSINGSDAQKVDVTACEAKVDGVDVKADAATSGTIAYTVANTRYDVVVINSDSTFSVVTGTAAATPVLPDIVSSQKPLWVLTVSTIAIALGWDARNQGAYYLHDGVYKYEWHIQDAIDDITIGEIFIGNGKYYNADIDLTGKTNITFVISSGASDYVFANINILSIRVYSLSQYEYSLTKAEATALGFTSLATTWGTPETGKIHKIVYSLGYSKRVFIYALTNVSCETPSTEKYIPTNIIEIESSPTNAYAINPNNEMPIVRTYTSGGGNFLVIDSSLTAFTGEIMAILIEHNGRTE